MDLKSLCLSLLNWPRKTEAYRYCMNRNHQKHDCYQWQLLPWKQVSDEETLNRFMASWISCLFISASVASNFVLMYYCFTVKFILKFHFRAQQWSMVSISQKSANEADVLKIFYSSWVYRSERQKEKCAFPPTFLSQFLSILWQNRNNIILQGHKTSTMWEIRCGMQGIHALSSPFHFYVVTFWSAIDF